MYCVTFTRAPPFTLTNLNREECDSNYNGKQLVTWQRNQPQLLGLILQQIFLELINQYSKIKN